MPTKRCARFYRYLTPQRRRLGLRHLLPQTASARLLLLVYSPNSGHFFTDKKRIVFSIYHTAFCFGFKPVTGQWAFALRGPCLH